MVKLNNMLSAFYMGIWQPLFLPNGYWGYLQEKMAWSPKDKHIPEKSPSDLS